MSENMIEPILVIKKDFLELTNSRPEVDIDR